MWWWPVQTWSLSELHFYLHHSKLFHLLLPTETLSSCLPHVSEWYYSLQFSKPDQWELLPSLLLHISLETKFSLFWPLFSSMPANIAIVENYSGFLTIFILHCGETALGGSTFMWVSCEIPWRRLWALSFLLGPHCCGLVWTSEDEFRAHLHSTIPNWSSFLAFAKSFIFLPGEQGL